MLCKIVSEPERDLHLVNEGFYLAYQRFEQLKSEEFEEVKEEIGQYLSVQEVLESLQKAIFVCKDTQEGRHSEDNKYTKMQNLLLLIKGEFEVIRSEDLGSQSDEILEDITQK